MLPIAVALKFKSNLMYCDPYLAFFFMTESSFVYFDFFLAEKNRSVNLLLALDSKSFYVSGCIGTHNHIFVIHRPLMCFEMGPPLRREKRCDNYCLLPPTSLLAYFPKIGLRDLHTIFPYQLLNAWTSLYETWYVYHGIWAHLSSVYHKHLPSVCIYVCPSYWY
jgi:hypothetical protein